ncbi:MAG: NTP transferase domain-containing protein [Candidatus Cloacimonetes bacterium]|nr:NTP transferase domain-containing protein [Candidatus Cloacimonadota bacterium]
MAKTRALILAAGKGKRMQTEYPKVLLTLKGIPMISHVINALKLPEIERIGLIVREEHLEDIRRTAGESVDMIVQKEALGTGQAVMCAAEWLQDFEGNLIVVAGDAPFITRELMTDLIRQHETSGSQCTLLSAIWPDTPAYGRIVRDVAGNFVKIVEEKDATEAEKAFREVSTSHYIFDARELFLALPEIRNDNAQEEYYLPDVVRIMIERNMKVNVLKVSDYRLTRGINTMEELREFSQN